MTAKCALYCTGDDPRELPWPDCTSAVTPDADCLFGRESDRPEALFLLHTGVRAALDPLSLPSVDSRWYVQRGKLISDSGPCEERASLFFAIRFSVPDEVLQDFDRWYVDEHVPMLKLIDGWLRIRRFELLAEGELTWNRLAVHELRNLATWESPQRRATRDTPWRQRLAATSWYRAHARGLYQILDPGEPAPDRS